MFLIVNRFLIRKGFTGITLWPFIILKKKELKQDVVLINHEKIHLRQQLELMIVPFFIWYGTEYLIRLIQYRDRREAYLNISFEREAYANEKDLNYLKKRSFWSFIKLM
ncbi:MAG: hypothetical protein KUG68_11290 [Flavobacteriaceae bacterium]|nr:hypothetical protein [Flavobacteriaceae bacterium]